MYVISMGDCGIFFKEKNEICVEYKNNINGRALGRNGSCDINDRIYFLYVYMRIKRFRYVRDIRKKLWLALCRGFMSILQIRLYKFSINKIIR